MSHIRRPLHCPIADFMKNFNSEIKIPIAALPGMLIIVIVTIIGLGLNTVLPKMPSVV